MTHRKNGEILQRGGEVGGHTLPNQTWGHAGGPEGHRIKGTDLGQGHKDAAKELRSFEGEDVGILVSETKQERDQGDSRRTIFGM